MFGLHILDIVSIGIYFLIVIIIGVVANRRIKESEDYFLGGRKFGKLVSIFLAFGSGTSSDTAISASRETYRAGMSGIWIQLLWLFITPFYWIIAPWYRRLRVVTGGDYFQDRFNSKVLTGLYVGFSLFYVMTVIAVGLTAIGKTVEIVTVKPESALTQSEKNSITLYEEYRALKSHADKLTPDERLRYDELDLQAGEGTIQAYYSYITTRQSVPIIAIIIILYGVLGGLFAAAWTDTLQGFLILVLSLLLLPKGLEQAGWFSGLHEKVPESMFHIFSSQTSSEYTWYYILMLIVLNLVGVVAQPHFFSTGGGSAKNERTAQIGMVAGNFLKRFTTIMWGLTGLVAFALYGNIVSDPDMIWGYATRQLLGPGFVGLMIACLLAASMSSADAFMISGSALFTRNFYEYLAPNREQAHYVLVGRLVSVGMIAGAIFLSLYFNNILSMIKYIWQLPVIFGAVFWVSLFWRRLTKTAALTAVSYSWLMIVLLPAILPEVPWVAAHKLSGIIVYPNLFILNTLGFELSQLSHPVLMTLNYGMQVAVPFSLLIVVSFFSRPPDERLINDIFARLNTPIADDRDEDKKEMKKYTDNPHMYDARKLSPKSDWEIMKPDRPMVIGFLSCMAIAVAVLGFAYLVSNLQIP